jgi:type II secretory pathway pseudopilin PulG
MRLPSRSRRRQNHPESGYVLLTLILMMALMAIAAGMLASSISFEIRRDKEEEMIHRGVQYSRAIRAYYKKFSRYPAKIEDLESTNQMRFLRKRYKDPLTGKDFRILHYGEAKMSMNALGGAGIAGASSLGPNGSLNSPGGFGQTSSFGGNSSFGAGLNTGMNSPAGQNSQQPAPGATADPSQPGSPSADGNGTSSSSTSSGGFTNLNGNAGDKLSNTQFGGAPIVGVASTSKDKTIREFDKKKKYEEWQFVYDPMFDRGFLITTPYQPSLQQAMGMQGTTNLNGQSNSGQSSSGFGNSFGNSPSPMQNNSTSPAGGYGSPSPSQPQSSPQQQ